MQEFFTLFSDKFVAISMLMYQGWANITVVLRE